MKNKLLFYFFTFSVVIGSAIYFFQKKEIYLPKLINNYLNDFLIVPIVLTISLYVTRFLRNSKEYKLSIGVIIYICVLYATLFEFIFPKYLSRYTADIIDVILYFAGGFVFYILQKK